MEKVRGGLISFFHYNFILSRDSRSWKTARSLNFYNSFIKWCVHGFFLMHTGLETPVPLSVPFPKEMPCRELKELISTWVSPEVSYLLSSETPIAISDDSSKHSSSSGGELLLTPLSQEPGAVTKPLQGLTAVWFHCDSAVNFPFQFFVRIAESQKSEEPFKESLEFHSEFILYHH